MASATPDVARLASVAARHLGEPVQIDGLRRLSGGASRESWSFDAVTVGGARHGLVLRRDPRGYAGESDRSVECSVLQAAHDAGVAVPAVWALLTPSDELGSGFVMQRVEGETIPRRVLRDEEYASARPRMAAQCGGLAARIHRVDTSRLPELPVRGAAEQIVQFREYLDSFGEHHPAFELGFRWLEEHVPPARQPVLVHGDFRNGNFVVGPEGIRAVLDWELAHLGDPVEDLGWLCVKSWRFGVVDRVVGGFGDVDDLLAAYRDAGGNDVDRSTLRYWETFGTLKWGVMCEIQAFTHLHGMVRSVELATIGRRVAEMEWDLLELIDPTNHQTAGASQPRTRRPADTIQDRPTAIELLEATREFLERDVLTAVDGRVAFHTRVAINALGIVGRELELGPGLDDAEQTRLVALLRREGSLADLTAELSRRIRDGSLDDRRAEVLAHVREAVHAKLQVANPRYLA